MKLIGLNGLTPDTDIRTRYIFIWLILNVLDAILTDVLVSMGVGYESNSLELVLGSHFLPVKLYLSVLVTILLIGNDRIMKVLCFGIGVVVMWNLFLLICNL